MKDIKDLQAIYGESKAQDGNTTYKFTPTTIQLGQKNQEITIDPGKAVMTLWDRAGTEGGIDTIDASGFDNTQNLYIDLRAGHFSAIGTLGTNAAVAPSGADINGDGDPDGDTTYSVGIAVGAQIENAKGGSGNDYLKGNDSANTLEGNGGADTLEGGAGNDILKGGADNDTYKFDGTYGTDTIEDTSGSGSGSIIINGQILSGGDYKFESIYKNEGTGYQYIKVNGGADLLVLKEGDANRIIINNWSETNNLSINLTGTAPATPTTGNAMNGDFKKDIIDDGVSSPYYQIVNNYVDEGPELNALDVINGTPNVDIIKGLGGSDFISGDGENDYIEGGDGGDFIQGGLGADTIYGGLGDDLIFAGTRVDLGPTGNPNFTPPTARYSVIVATGFNWVYSTSVIAENGVGINGWINIKGGNEFLGDAAFGGDDVTNLIDGGDGDDHILGGIGGDYLLGGTGKDFILGYSGGDIILGGDDNDYINGDLGYIDLANGNGNDVIDGGSGVDVIIAEGSNDIVFGGSENDFLWGDYEDETASGGNDLLVGGAGDDQLVGGGGSDTLIGGTGTDSLFGGEGNDYLDGGTDGSNDVLSGEAGDDTLVGGEGADSLYGGAGSDMLYVSDADSISGQDKDNKITFLGGGNANVAAVSTNATLGGAAITLNLGTATINLLDGLVGKGDATYTFADGSQILHSDLIGTRLNSVVNIASASNAIFGGMLADNMQATGTADSSLFGGLGNDILIGNDGSNALNGGAGDDYLNGGAGNDTLTGGAGNDILFGSDGTDTYLFSRGDGADVASVLQSTKYLDDIIQLGANISASDVVLTRAPNGYSSELQLSIAGTTDSIRLSSYFNSEHIDYKYSINYKINNTLIRYADGTVWTYDDIKSRIVATNANDILEGTLSADVIHGLAGDDTIYGDDGNDQIFGDAGNDTLWGNAGNDTLDGGAGNDRYIDAAGADTYVFGKNSQQDAINWAFHPFNGIDNVTFEAGITSNNLIFSQSQEYPNDLLIIRRDTDALLILEGYFDAALTAGKQTEFKFNDGTTWYRADVLANLSTTDFRGSNFTGFGPGLQTTIHGGDGNQYIIGSMGIDQVYGDAGNDTLAGGLGYDTLEGGTGSDTYLFGKGAGVDTIFDSGDVVGDANTLIISADPSEVSLSRNDSYSITFSIQNTADTITIGNYFDGFAGLSTYATYNIQFLNGAIWDTNTILAKLLEGSENVDFLRGYNTNDLITGKGGNYIIYGYLGNDTLDGGADVDELNGNAGDDTYIVDNIADTVIENANEGLDLVLSSVNITLSNNVENLTLTGSATINGIGNTLANIIIGNDAANILTGGSGNDTLNGGAGNDTIDGGTGNDSMAGGDGDDIYFVNVATDVITEALNAATDTVKSSITYVLGATSNLENLILTGTSAINGAGNTLANVITGNSAANTLDGGTGADTLIGGAGNDIYTVDNALDIVTENLNEGTDRVNSSIAFSIATFTNVENLTLTGANAINSTGNALDNVLTGNSGNNSINGGAGNDTIDGGTGNDTMVGGAGNDVYFMNVSTDVVTELAGEGTDTINSAVTLSIATLTNIENITLTGATAINATGNTLDNTLTGNTGNNSISGGAGNDTINGGTGNDTMIGGAGNDVYFVNIATDVVAEIANEGTDTVNSAVTYSLASLANIENVTLTGSTAINATGNALANTLIGNSGNNILTGGTGADILTGGLGTDTFDFNAILDSLVGTSRDVITDFSRVQLDKIDLSTIDANSALANDQAFAAIILTSGAFTAAGQLRLVGNVLSGNTDSNFATSEFEIQLTGVTSLVSTDFIM